MEERELFEQYRKTHDRELRNKIVEKYLYIAAVIAKKFVGRGVEYDDLYQVASLALMKGVDRFDETKGLKFSTFITPTIAGEIKNYFRDSSRLIHLPRRVTELRAAIARATEQTLAETGKKPTARRLAADLNVPEEEIVRALEAGGVVSLDRSIDCEEGEGESFHDLIPASENFYEELENRDELASALGTLSATERKIVELRFRKELSQTETAKQLGVSQMYVSRMERKILSKLKETLRGSMAE